MRSKAIFCQFMHTYHFSNLFILHTMFRTWFYRVSDEKICIDKYRSSFHVATSDMRRQIHYWALPIIMFFTQKLQYFKPCYYAITDSYRLVYAWQFSKEISCNDHSNLKEKNYIIPWIQHLLWNNNINDASGRSAFYSWIYFYFIEVNLWYQEHRSHINH